MLLTYPDARHGGIDALNAIASARGSADYVVDEVAGDLEVVVSVVGVATAGDDAGATVQAAVARDHDVVDVVGDRALVAALHRDADRSVPASARDVEALDVHVVAIDLHNGEGPRRGRADPGTPSGARHEADAPPRPAAPAQDDRSRVMARTDAYDAPWAGASGRVGDRPPRPLARPVVGVAALPRDVVDPLRPRGQHVALGARTVRDRGDVVRPALAIASRRPARDRGEAAESDRDGEAQRTAASPQPACSHPELPAGARSKWFEEGGASTPSGRSRARSPASERS